MATPFILPFIPAFGVNAVLLPGATLLFQEPGTTTPKSVYTSAALSTAHESPVEADADGRFPAIYLDPAESYRVTLKTAAGATIGDVDNFTTEDSQLRNDLSDDSGSAEVGFLQAGGSAVARTVQAKLRDVVSVRDFGAVGDNTADDTLAIQAAIDSGAGSILFPAMAQDTIYKITGKITVPGQVELVGQGMWASCIQSTDLDAPIFEIEDGSANVTIRNLHLRYSGTPIAGADAIVAENCQTCSFLDLWISTSWNGIHLIDGGNHMISNYRCYEYENAAFYLKDCLDVNLSSYRFHAGDSIRGRSGGIFLEGGVEAFTASQGDITLGVHAIKTANTGSATRGFAPFYNRLTQTFFDTSLNQCAYLRSVFHTDFDNCWFASAGHDHAVGFEEAGDYAGIDMADCQHVRFTGGECHNNGGKGAILAATCKFVTFIGTSFKRNGFSRASSTPAVLIAANTTDFSITDCAFEEDADTATFKQDVAVEVATGTSDRYFVADNLLGGCTVTDNGSGANKRVENNY